jgi:hypothetical protein
MRISIVYRNCPRCGKKVAGLNRSLYGADKTHAKYAGLCAGCVTEAERRDMLAAQAGAMLGCGPAGLKGGA